jgi:hypothetical protein
MYTSKQDNRGMNEMSKHTYAATKADGTIVKRTTNRVYTHVVIAHWENKIDGNYTRVEWCGRLDLAQKVYKKYVNSPNVTLQIIPVDNPRESGEVVTTKPTAEPTNQRKHIRIEPIATISLKN